VDGWKQIPLSHSSPHIDEKDMKGYEVRAANPLRFSRHGHVSFPLSLSLSLSLSHQRTVRSGQRQGRASDGLLEL